MQLSVKKSFSAIFRSLLSSSSLRARAFFAISIVQVRLTLCCVNICFVVKDVASAVHRFVTLLNAHSLRHAGKMTRFVMLTKLPWRHNFDVSITGQGWRSNNCPRNDLFLLAQRLEYNQFALQKDFKKILNVVQLR